MCKLTNLINAISSVARAFAKKALPHYNTNTCYPLPPLLQTLVASGLTGAESVIVAVASMYARKAINAVPIPAMILLRESLLREFLCDGKLLSSSLSWRW